MNPGQFFTRAAALLPDAVRERLDGDSPLDWAAYESAETESDIGAAAQTGRRLAPAVEALAHRLIADIGIVPADLAAGIERQGAASAWIPWVTLESDGETCLIRNDRSGEVYMCVRPEAVAGYAALAMDLATTLHYAVEQWRRAADRHRATPDDRQSDLARCAVHMGERLQTLIDGATAGEYARTLERAWNGQDGETREALAGVRLATAPGVRAPRANHYTPAASHRLHACDADEIRWLRALAEHAAGGARREPPPPAPPERAPAKEEAAVTLALGSDPATLTPPAEIAELQRAVNHLPGAVRRRMGETWGPAVGEELARFENPAEVEALSTRLAAGEAGAPRWLEALAESLLADSGAATRDGLRTAGMSLERAPAPESGYRATETDSGKIGTLTPIGLIEQLRLSIAFAHDAWVGFSALQSAGKEGDWALGEVESGNGELAAGERETLEAAQEIGQALGRIGRARTGEHGDREPGALEQAAMAAEALVSIGPTLRAAAGWPGGAPPPNGRDPSDVARMVSVAEALHGEIRSIANRLIAGWIADVRS